MHRWYTARLDELDFDQLRVQVTRWSELYNRAEREHRGRKRAEAFASYVMTDARDAYGDLLDKVMQRDDRIARQSRIIARLEAETGITRHTTRPTPRYKVFLATYGDTSTAIMPRLKPRLQVVVPGQAA